MVSGVVVTCTSTSIAGPWSSESASAAVGGYVGVLEFEERLREVFDRGLAFTGVPGVDVGA
jgi:hypothetical protein